MHWNQENGPALFGFIETGQRDLFCLLISVSGIGPRMALALLSAFPVSTLINALVSGDVSLLSSVSGIGRKKAETLILNLKEKAEKFIVPLSVAGNATGFAIHIKDLSEAVDQLRGVEGASNFAFDQLLRKSLQFLSKGR
jgi:Holliday junction DNA helicase RuvA